MKRCLIITFALLLLMSMSSFATNTRVLTMGGTNNVMLDEANIWLYPSRIANYPDLAIGEFSQAASEIGRNPFTNFGFHWSHGENNKHVEAAYISTLPAVYPVDFFGNLLVPFDSPLLDNRLFEAFSARRFSTVTLGVLLSFFQSSQKWEVTSDVTSVEEIESFRHYNFLFSLTPNTGLWDIALGYGFGNWTDRLAGVDLTRPDGYHHVMLMGRYFWQRKPSITNVPHIGFLYGKRGVKDYLNNTDKNTMTAFDIGFGTNYTPVNDAFIVTDFGLQYAKAKKEVDITGLPDEEHSESAVAMYLLAGLDAKVFDWLDLRLGGTSILQFGSSEDIIEPLSWKYTRAYYSNDTYLGFGFHWGDLHVDTYTDPNLFLKGFNFISGETTSMNFQISALYEIM